MKLLAVTKTVTKERVREALQAGITTFGENYIQEAHAKIPEVRGEMERYSAPPEWHFIGHLQRNKVKDAVGLFSLIQTVDTVPLGQEIGRQIAKQGRTAQPVLLEVRLGDSEGGEPQRAGIRPEAVLDFAEQINDIVGVTVRGLMAIAPYGTTGETARPYFAQVRNLWEKLPPENRHELSMGMTNDFEAAIQEGATIVRIGTALFGKRNAQ